MAPRVEKGYLRGDPPAGEPLGALAVVNPDGTNIGGGGSSGGLTDAQLRASAVPVSGPLTDVQLRATAVPVSGPLTDAQLRAAAVPVSGTFWQATQPVSGTFWQATQPVSIAATVATDPTDRAARAIGTVTQQTITKGTQGSTGVTTQDLKDAGRTRVTIRFQGAAPATADTLLSLVKTSAGVAAAGATSIGVAANKILRITAITFSLKANAAAAAFGTMTLRSNPSGATVIGSQSELRLDVGNTEAVVGAARAITIAIPDGMEFSGTETIGISLAAQAVTNIVSISLTGFEY